jgi:membrane protein
MIWLGRVWSITRQTLTEYIDDDGLRLSASLAFYSVLSLAPILIFALALAGTIWDTAAARVEVSRYVTEFIGTHAAEMFLAVLDSAATSADAAYATIVGAIVLVIGSTAAFAELQSGLNLIWKVEESSQVRAFVRRRLVSAAIVLLIAMLLMLSVVVATTVSIVAGIVRTGSSLGEGAWYLLQHGTFLAAFTLLFATMFKFLPNTSVRWRQVWGGAAFTALLFLVGKFLIRIYLEQASLESSYGAAGSVIAFLLWVYYSAIIFYLGAKLTSVSTRRPSSAG